MKDRLSITLYLLVIALFLLFSLPWLLADGMFVDGLWYAVISRNLANGIGSFWYPHLTDTYSPTFHAHPPLAFALQGLFFNVLGDSKYTERIYALCTHLVAGYLVVLIWREAGLSAKQGWLPLLLWIIIPQALWGLVNNILENTMVVFILLSVLFFIKYTKQQQIGFLCISGFMITLALLTKGPTGLYPLSLPLWYWAVNRKKRFINMCAETGVLAIAALGPVLLLMLLWPAAQHSIVSYIDFQIIGSMRKGQNVESRFFIIRRMIEELLPAIGICVLMVIIFWKQRVKLNEHYPLFLFFGLVALSGVLPIMVSLKQIGFYINTTFPLFAIALGAFILPLLAPKINAVKQASAGVKALRYVTGLAWCAAIGIAVYITQAGVYSRDEALIKETATIIETVKEERVLTACPKVWDQLSLHAYLYRMGNVSLDTLNGHAYYITIGEESSLPAGADKKYIPVSSNTQEFRLYKRR